MAKTKSKKAPGRTFKCPHCKKKLNAGSILRSFNSEAQRKASAINGAKGGRPPGSLNKKK